MTNKHHWILLALAVLGLYLFLRLRTNSRAAKAFTSKTALSTPGGGSTQGGTYLPPGKNTPGKGTAFLWPFDVPRSNINFPDVPLDILARN